ncbi:DUF397 domain-containing protein [Saccharothrix lopnurensis]|uniref:DUF397 domain-containing protein n=1 Tax=Saccharothrix lopnurensis TaxID=1670621 RepID=A0ABW1PGF8_9PSEU
MTEPVPPLRWRRSSRSGSEGNCVEVGSTFDRLRDSKRPTVELGVSRGALHAFLQAAADGRFDPRG